MFDFASETNSPVKEENVCDTKFCIAGWQAYKEGYPEEYLNANGYFFNYGKFSFDKVDDNEDAWDFFYSSRWSNDKEYAKERMRFVIENKAIPKFSNDELIFEGFPW